MCSISFMKALSGFAAGKSSLSFSQYLLLGISLFIFARKFKDVFKKFQRNLHRIFILVPRRKIISVVCPQIKRLDNFQNDFGLSELIFLKEKFKVSADDLLRLEEIFESLRNRARLRRIRVGPSYFKLVKDSERILSQIEKKGSAEKLEAYDKIKIDNILARLEKIPRKNRSKEIYYFLAAFYILLPNSGNDDWEFVQYGIDSLNCILRASIMQKGDAVLDQRIHNLHAKLYFEIAARLKLMPNNGEEFLEIIESAKIVGMLILMMK